MFKFLDAVAGFGVTLKTIFKKPITEQYPEKPGATAPRYHGRHQLNRYPDGQIGRASCRERVCLYV